MIASNWLDVAGQLSLPCVVLQPVEAHPDVSSGSDNQCMHGVSTGDYIEPLRAAIRAERKMGHASTLLRSAALEEIAELGLGIETHRHAALAVRDRNRKLITFAFVAAALLDKGTWRAWIFSVVPSENLHRSTRRKRVDR